MKTRLLKKLRKEADSVLYVTEGGPWMYLIGNRPVLTFELRVWDHRRKRSRILFESESKMDVFKRCKEARREYILKRVERIRQQRNIYRYDS